MGHVFDGEAPEVEDVEEVFENWDTLTEQQQEALLKDFARRYWAEPPSYEEGR